MFFCFFPEEIVFFLRNLTFYIAKAYLFGFFETLFGHPRECCAVNKKNALRFVKKTAFLKIAPNAEAGGIFRDAEVFAKYTDKKKNLFFNFNPPQ